MKGYYYPGDPYWTTIKFTSNCERCKKVILKGERVFYYKGGYVYCNSDDCGQLESRSFEAAAQDEFNYGGSR